MYTPNKTSHASAFMMRETYDTWNAKEDDANRESARRCNVELATRKLLRPRREGRATCCCCCCAAMEQGLVGVGGGGGGGGRGRRERGGGRVWGRGKKGTWTSTWTTDHSTGLLHEWRCLLRLYGTVLHHNYTTFTPQNKRTSNGREGLNVCFEV